MMKTIKMKIVILQTGDFATERPNKLVRKKMLGIFRIYGNYQKF